MNTLLAMKEQPSIINERVLIAPLRSVPNIRYTHDGTTESWLENNNAGGEDQGIKTYIGLTSAVPGLLVLPWLVEAKLCDGLQVFRFSVSGFRISHWYSLAFSKTDLVSAKFCWA